MWYIYTYMYICTIRERALFMCVTATFGNEQRVPRNVTQNIVSVWRWRWWWWRRCVRVVCLLYDSLICLGIYAYSADWTNKFDFPVLYICMVGGNERFYLIVSIMVFRFKCIFSAWKCVYVYFVQYWKCTSIILYLSIRLMIYITSTAAQCEFFFLR